MGVGDKIVRDRMLLTSPSPSVPSAIRHISPNQPAAEDQRALSLPENLKQTKKSQARGLCLFSFSLQFPLRIFSCEIQTMTRIPPSFSFDPSLSPSPSAPPTAAPRNSAMTRRLFSVFLSFGVSDRGSGQKPFPSPSLSLSLLSLSFSLLTEEGTERGERDERIEKEKSRERGMIQ